MRFIDVYLKAFPEKAAELQEHHARLEPLYQGYAAWWREQYPDQPFDEEARRSEIFGTWSDTPELLREIPDEEVPALVEQMRRRAAAGGGL